VVGVAEMSVAGVYTRESQARIARTLNVWHFSRTLTFMKVHMKHGG